MREIKFRGKDIESGEWLYGDLRQRLGYYPAIIESYCTDEGKVGYREVAVEEETVGQFTGLRDKNGLDIYEGDIVECVSWNEYFSNGDGPMEPFRRKMYVDFRKGGFKMVEPMPQPMKDNEWDIIFNGDIVIVGNIYDNPDLIDMKRLGKFFTLHS